MSPTATAADQTRSVIRFLRFTSNCVLEQRNAAQHRQIGIRADVLQILQRGVFRFLNAGEGKTY